MNFQFEEVKLGGNGTNKLDRKVTYFLPPASTALWMVSSRRACPEKSGAPSWIRGQIRRMHRWLEK
jgi:hypothetical protein